MVAFQLLCQQVYPLLTNSQTGMIFLGTRQSNSAIVSSATPIISPNPFSLSSAVQSLDFCSTVSDIVQIVAARFPALDAL